MANNDVNDVVVKLLASADRVGGREGDEILYLVGKLSRAATRERDAAVYEMHNLRKTIVQQDNMIKRIGYREPDSSQAHHSPQVPMTGGYGSFDHSHDRRADAQRSSQPPRIDHGPEHGRLSRPGELTQPRRTSSSETAQAGATRTALHAAANSPVAHGSKGAGPMAGASTMHATGYEHFNQDRLLALQGNSASPDDEHDRCASSSGAAPVYKPTAANAEPVGTRKSKAVGDAATSGGEYDRRALDLRVPDRRDPKNAVRFLEKISFEPQKPELKRKAAGPAPPKATAKKVARIEGPPSMNTRSKNTLIKATANPDYRTPVCISCIEKRLDGCDGKSHCNNCKGIKCIYVGCIRQCPGSTCVKIHPCQHDPAARKPGEARRVVVTDCAMVETLKEHDYKMLINALNILLAPSAGAKPAALGLEAGGGSHAEPTEVGPQPAMLAGAGLAASSAEKRGKDSQLPASSVSTPAPMAFMSGAETKRQPAPLAGGLVHTSLVWKRAEASSPMQASSSPMPPPTTSLWKDGETKRQPAALADGQLPKPEGPNANGGSQAQTATKPGLSDPRQMGQTKQLSTGFHSPAFFGTSQQPSQPQFPRQKAIGGVRGNTDAGAIEPKESTADKLASVGLENKQFFMAANDLKKYAEPGEDLDWFNIADLQERRRVFDIITTRKRQREAADATGALAFPSESLKPRSMAPSSTSSPLPGEPRVKHEGFD